MDTGGTWHSITHLIAAEGWKESRNDIDGSSAGRNILGDMIRDLVARKARYDVTLRPITKAEKDFINDLLYPSEFYVRFKEDGDVSWTQRLMYSNNYSWVYFRKGINGVEMYKGFSFPLVEI